MGKIFLSEKNRKMIDQSIVNTCRKYVQAITKLKNDNIHVGRKSEVGDGGDNFKQAVNFTCSF